MRRRSSPRSRSPPRPFRSVNSVGELPQFSMQHEGHCFLNGTFDDATMSITVEDTIQVAGMKVPGIEVVRDFKRRASAPYFLKIRVVPYTAGEGLPKTPEKETGKGSLVQLFSMNIRSNDGSFFIQTTPTRL